MAHARVEAVTITPQMGIARVEAVKLASRIDFHIIFITEIPYSDVWRVYGGTSHNNTLDKAVTKFWCVRRWKH